ncbi:MAG TPA: hypothetical protein VGR57_18475 [Ktedonobacterales bacterium]|nr:hypothetical protein [Ktedonobacterales bacterium]
MTTMPLAGRPPRIMLLWFEPSILGLLHDVLRLEGYPITATQSARRAINRIVHTTHPYVVLMDNFHLGHEARALAAKVFATPELHERVRVIGLNAQRSPQLIALDAFIGMPFTVEGLLDPIAAACADLRATMGGP